MGPGWWAGQEKNGLILSHGDGVDTHGVKNVNQVKRNFRAERGFSKVRYIRLINVGLDWIPLPASQMLDLCL